MENYICVATNGFVLANPQVLSQGWTEDKSKAHRYASRKEAERDGRQAGKGYASSPRHVGLVPCTFSHVETLPEENA
jgi:hypothetical protein